MKTLTTKLSALVFAVAFLTVQNVSAQCAITTGPTNDCSYGDAIDNFTIGATTASNPGCTNGTGYSTHISPVFNLDLDVAYPLSAAVGGATYNQGMAIWIDLNNNGVYESSEQVWASTTAALSFTSTITVASTFPGIVTGTPLPMRVMCVYNQVIPAGNACTSGQNTYGETEDYAVILSTVVPPSNVEATAVFEPFNDDCGHVSDSVKVTVSNLTATDEVDVPVELQLTGAVTGTYYDTIPSLLGNTSQDLTMAVVNTQLGGTLNAELIVNLGDDDPTDDTLSVSINIFDATDLSITGDSIVCEGDSIDLVVSNQNGGEIYTWYLDGATFATGSNTNSGPLSSAAQIVVASDNACRANDTLDVAVNLLPVVSYTSAVTTGTVDFTGTAANEDSVSWDFGDGTSSSAMNPQHEYTTNGSYVVCFTGYNSCGAVTSCDTVEISTIGLDELFLGAIVEAYPNPTSDLVTISFDGENSFTGKWKLYTLEGKQLNTNEVDDASEFSIDLAGYPIGTYVLNLESDSGETYKMELMRH